MLGLSTTFAGLNRPLRIMLGGILLNALGSGFSLSLLLVYLNDIRGISTVQGGWILSWMAVLGLASAGPVGILIDRIGPVRLLLPGVIVEAVSVGCWALVTEPWQAWVVATFIALSGATIWPSQSVIFAQLAGPELRERTFGISFMMLNLGLGLGGAGAALIIRDGDVGRFQLLYVVDALTYAFLALAVFLIRHDVAAARARIRHEREQAELADEPSYAVILRDRRLVKLVLGAVIAFTCGYGAIQAGLPVFATQYADLSARWIGIIFGANTLTIVLLQTAVLTWIKGRSRSRLLGLLGALWAVSWVVVGVSTVWMPVLLLAISQVIFALAETIWAPVGPALLNDMAPDNARGRYNATMGLVWGVSGVAGPALTGQLLGTGHPWVWLNVMFAGAAIGGAIMYSLRRDLDPRLDGRVEG